MEYLNEQIERKTAYNRVLALYMQMQLIAVAQMKKG